MVADMRDGRTLEKNAEWWPQLHVLSASCPSISSVVWYPLGLPGSHGNNLVHRRFGFTS